jgi:hypothetical protein
MLLSLLLLLAGPNECISPDLLGGRGGFEAWAGNDADGWERTSVGNGIHPSAGNRGFGASFETVYGPATLSADVQLTGVEHRLSVWMWGLADKTVAVRVRDMTSGHYLNEAGSWQDTETDALVQRVIGITHQLYGLSFAAEAPGRTLRIELHSNRFGSLGSNGFYSCLPDASCPAGAADSLRLCAR